MNEPLLRPLKDLCRATLFIALLLLLLVPVAGAEDTLNLDKAIKIGTGKIMVIEFTDPDCPFCRKAEAYFQGRQDVTRYVFLLPLARHPASKGKAQYILSAKDKAKAYLEVAAGKFDQSNLAEITPEGIRLQKQHQDIAKANKMTNTPTFMIYGRIIEGFDLKRLAPLLK